MKNFSVKRKWFICLTLIVVDVILYLCANKFVQDDIKKRPYTSSNEFLQTIDCAAIFDANPDAVYVIEFDIRAEKSGKVRVYQQNGSTARYSFQEYVDVTEEYQTMRIVVQPVLLDEAVENSMLAFYGEYGTGIIPEVKNISIREKEE